MTYPLPKYMAPIMVVALAFLFGSCFATKPVFFQYLVTAKQWQLEQGVLLAAMILVVFLPFIRNVRITAIDVGVFLLASWVVFSAFFIHKSDYRSQHEVLFHVILWLTVHLFVRSGSGTGSGWFHWSVLGILLGISLFQSVRGLMQLYGFEASHHGLFKITGTFHNPGPFSGFVVSALPLALFCYTEINRGDTEKHGDKNSRKIPIKWLNFPINRIWTNAIKWLSLLTIIAILLIIPAAQSRAAWVAGAAGCLFVFLAHPATSSFRNKLRTSFKRLSFWARMFMITGTVIGIIGAGTGLYLMKKDSANGRLLIWQVTGQLIKDQPMAGHGSGAFEALYMDEQGQWFESGKGTQRQAMVAGSPGAPFNEPLKLWLEKGLIGVLLAAGVLGVIFFHGAFKSKQETKNKKLFNLLPLPPNPREGEPPARNFKTQNSKPPTRNSEPGTLNPEL